MKKTLKIAIFWGIVGLLIGSLLTAFAISAVWGTAFIDYSITNPTECQTQTQLVYSK